MGFNSGSQPYEAHQGGNKECVLVQTCAVLKEFATKHYQKHS